MEPSGGMFSLSVACDTCCIVIRRTVFRASYRGLRKEHAEQV